MRARSVNDSVARIVVLHGGQDGHRDFRDERKEKNTMGARFNLNAVRLSSDSLDEPLADAEGFDAYDCI